MEFTTLALGVHLYSNVQGAAPIITAVESILSPDKEIDWAQAKISVRGGDYKVDPSFRDNLFFSMNFNNPHLSEESKNNIKDVSTIIDIAVQSALSHYQESLGVWIGKQEPYEILKYSKNNHLNWHTDDGSSERSRVSMLYYLNDDYEGGELEFANFDVLYKPVAGDILIFPSSFIYKHRFRQVTEGTRYVIADFMA